MIIVTHFVQCRALLPWNKVAQLDGDGACFGISILSVFGPSCNGSVKEHAEITFIILLEQSLSYSAELFR